MTALTKTLIATSLALAAGLAYQVRLLSRQSDQLHVLKQKSVDWEMRAQQTREQRSRTLTALSATQQALESLRIQPSAEKARDTELQSWLSRVHQLKEWLRRAPKKNIPEMRFLNSSDWLSVTLDNHLETDAKIRDALSRLRSLAKTKPEVIGNISAALQAYAKANDGRPATEPAQLRPYLNPSLDDDILQRYEYVPAFPGENDADVAKRNGMRIVGSGRIGWQEKTAADEDYDTLISFTEKGGYFLVGTSKLGDAVNKARQAFTKANNGQSPINPEQLLPYFATPVDETKFREFWQVNRK